MWYNSYSVFFYQKSRIFMVKDAKIIKGIFPTRKPLGN